MTRRQFMTVAALACGAGCSGVSTSSTPNTQSGRRTNTEHGIQTETASERTPTLRERDIPVLDLGETYAWSGSVDFLIDEVEFTRTRRMVVGEVLSPSAETVVLEVRCTLADFRRRWKGVRFVWRDSASLCGNTESGSLSTEL